jgi:hypothetical protein
MATERDRTASLVGVTAGIADRRFDLGEDPVRLGRDSACSIHILDPRMSRKHAEIRMEAGSYIIYDLGSTHGTWVDGKRVGEARLSDGSHIRLGDSEFVFRLNQEAIPTMMYYEDEKPPGKAPPSPGLKSDATSQRFAPFPRSPVPPFQPPISPPSKSRQNRLIVACGAAGILGICGCLAFFGLSQLTPLPGNLVAAFEQGLSRAGKGYSPQDLELALGMPIGDERREILDNFGRPDEFDIAVIQVEGGRIRRESWRYYGFGTQVDFVDGAIVWTVELEPALQGTFFPAWYDPTDFETGMSIEAASALLTVASPAGAAPEMFDLSDGGDDLVGGTLLIGDQIMLGFQDGTLVYVETIGASGEESGG